MTYEKGCFRCRPMLRICRGLRRFRTWPTHLRVSLQFHRWRQPQMTFETVQRPHDTLQVESPVLAVCRTTEPNKVTGVAAERRHHGIRADRLEGLAEARVADLVTEEVTPEATDHQEDHQARLGDPTDRRMVGPGGLRMGAPAAVDRLGDLARCAVCIT